MENKSPERITALRKMLEQNGLAAFIIPSTDPHLSEYVAPHWKSRAWISGFTGSAGTVVVTKREAGLWTDSRYFIQAEQQLDGTGIRLFKEGMPGTPSVVEWLCDTLQPGMKIGIDGKMFSVDEVENLQKEFEKAALSLEIQPDPMEKLWENRPTMPQNPAYIYPTEYAGVSSAEKIREIRSQLLRQGIKGMLISALDEIAWTLNIRGNDVKCNPVTISYLLITENQVTYFITPEKLTEEVKNYLISQHIEVQDYKTIEKYLGNYPLENIQINPSKTNYCIYSSIRPSCKIIKGASPVTLLKAVRNEQEIKGVHAAMVRDGVALVKFLKWLEEAVPQGGETEISIDRKLHEFRAAQDLYQGESFDTIAGYKEHGAIVHYSARPESDVTLKPEGLLLIDSGAQYLDGTTDITRTLALGPVSEEEKKDYTLVLKGHIDLAACQFPYGTRGAQLDVLARLPLWQNGMNFFHGTGHGVGHFLSVHEGPQSIRMNENPVALLPGMLTSNEPGVYKGGRHGIRIENLLLVVASQTTEFGQFLQFETVTLCPIDTTPVLWSLLTEEEINWLNTYHQTVYEKLSPYLNEEEKNWLRQKTKKIII